MKRIFLALTVFGFCSCSVFRPAGGDGRITVNFLQINDVYEIAPLSGGAEGGMARVATIKKQLLDSNRNTYMVVAGDFLSPSVFNGLQYEGKLVRGKQMVEAMNVAGMDIAIFGNHEFDIREHELQERINESKFQWISSNAFHKKLGIVTPFIKPGVGPFPEFHIMAVSDADGTTARIGIFALVLPFNRVDYVSYTDPLQTARKMYDQLRDSAVDAIVAITHQSMQADEQLARELPGLTVIIGGHEHDQRFSKIGNVYITKALANARSAYVVQLNINKSAKAVDVSPRLISVDQSIPLDSATNAVVEKWTGIAERNYSTLGFDVRDILLSTTEPLDGRETEVRRTTTNLVQLIVRSMQHAAPQADVVLLNGGSIRVDDVLHAPITQYDILRTLPFGGAIKETDVKGKLLIDVLNAGQKNTGSGGYLHYNAQVTKNTAGQWLISGKKVDPNAIYRVAMPEFLLTGREANMEFLNSDLNADVVRVYDTDKRSASLGDIRMAVVNYLKAERR